MIRKLTVMGTVRRAPVAVSILQTQDGALLVDSTGAVLVFIKKAEF